MEVFTFAWQLVVILFLVLANGFFVAAEFAIVKIRTTQLKPLLTTKDWRVPIAINVVRHLDAYLSATQLGITLSSLALGAWGKPYVVTWMMPLLSAFGITSGAIHDTLAIGIAFIIISFLHIVLGELAPKSLSIRKPKETTLWISAPLTLFYYVLFPAIWVLNGTANRVLSIIGLNPASETDHAFSPEELQHVLMHSTHNHGPDELINKLMLKALRLKETTADQVMLPRDQVSVLWRDKPVKDNLQTAQRAGYSRMPVCGKSLDEVLGIILIKELLWQYQALGDETEMASITRPALTFLPKTRLPAMLELFRKSRNHFAVVVDTEDHMLGIVSFEDVLEELVGDIRDEFDIEKGPFFERSATTALVDATLTMRDLALETGWPLPHKAETVGSWCAALWGRIPGEGEILEHEGMQIVAAEVSLRGLRRVRFIRPQPVPAEPVKK